jgi:hypothetical protein
VTEKTWTTEWPKEKGAYWFFGQCFGYGDVKMHLVEVWRDGAGSCACGTNVHCLYEAEGTKGQWLKVIPPEAPCNVPIEITRSLRQLKNDIDSTKRKVYTIQGELGALMRMCESQGHRPVRHDNSCICLICGENLGWWCDKSPIHRCLYNKDGSENCLYCGEPEERK